MYNKPSSVIFRDKSRLVCINHPSAEGVECNRALAELCRSLGPYLQRDHHSPLDSPSDERCHVQALGNHDPFPEKHGDLWSWWSYHPLCRNQADRRGNIAALGEKNP